MQGTKHAQVLTNSDTSGGAVRAVMAMRDGSVVKGGGDAKAGSAKLWDMQDATRCGDNRVYGTTMIGDADGDGVADAAIGCPAADSFTGRVVVVMITATGRRKRCECTMCDWHDAVHGVSVSVRSHREICSDGAECGNHNLRHYTITTNMTQTTNHANATRDKRCQYMHHSMRAGEVKQSMASSNTTLGNGGLQTGEQYGFNLDRMDVDGDGRSEVYQPAAKPSSR